VASGRVEPSVKRLKSVLRNYSLHPAIDSSGAKAEYGSLRAENYISALDGYRQDRRRSVCAIPEIVASLLREIDEVVVFALDALSFSYFMEAVHPFLHREDKMFLGSLTSVFPATTSTAWTSMLTGKPPWEHGVYGTSFLLEGSGGNYVWLNDSLSLGKERVVLKYPSDRIRLNLSDASTLFQILSRDGVNVSYLGSHGLTAPNRLNDELTAGAVQVRVCPDPEVKLRLHEYLDFFLKKSGELLAAGGGKRLVWNYVDTDEYIHRYGYKMLTRAFPWEKLFGFWRREKRPGRAFILVSDHGQVPQRPGTFNFLRETETNPLFRYNTGGAGRVLYFYPAPDKAEEAASWLRSSIGDTGILLKKHQLVEYGLFSHSPIAFDRVGELVAIGKTDRFPSAGPAFISEHGSITEGEMFVPLLLFP